MFGLPSGTIYVIDKKGNRIPIASTDISSITDFEDELIYLFSSRRIGLDIKLYDYAEYQNRYGQVIFSFDLKELNI